MPALNEQEQQELADKLAGLSYQAARKEIRRLDPEANLKTYRNGVKHEWHTLYELPNLHIRVVLVEQIERRPVPDKDVLKREYYFTEARIETWSPPA